MITTTYIPISCRRSSLHVEMIILYFNRQSIILDQCEASEKQQGDSVSAAAERCQTVGEDLSLLWDDLMGLRQILHTLPMGMRISVSPMGVERDISSLQDTHSKLESRCSRLLSLLKNRLTLWHNFNKQLEMVQQSVQEADYMMELLSVQGSVDYDRLIKATERLKVSNFIHFITNELVIPNLTNSLVVNFRKNGNNNNCTKSQHNRLNNNQTYKNQIKRKIFMSITLTYIHNKIGELVYNFELSILILLEELSNE